MRCRAAEPCWGWVPAAPDSENSASSEALPVAALREAVALVRGLLAGETVQQQGKVISLTGARLGFTPPRRDIPVYFATHGSQITRLAAQVADGVLIANTLDASGVRALRDAARAGLR